VTLTVSLASTIVFANLTVNNVTINNPTQATASTPNWITIPVQSSGSTLIPVTVSFNYSLSVENSCPGCIDQVELGINTDAGPQSCVYSGSTPASGSVSPAININVPNAPGRYYISIDRGQAYSCSTGSWWNGSPNAARYIAAVDVVGPAY
jgi:hypothetical protein